jgi:UPF0755 protein
MRTLRLALLALLAASLVSGGLLFELRRRLVEFRDTPFGTASDKVVEIPPGAVPRQAVRLLARHGVVRDETLAWRYVRWMKRDPRTMKAGEYSFTGPLRPDEVLERVYRGEVKTYQFTVPEGLRMDEIAGVVQQAGLGRASELLQLMHDAAFARELGVPFPNLEGYLFPDTYTFPRDPSPRAVLAAMVARFREEYRKAEADRLPCVTLDEKGTVTLASIVEKETGQPEERPRVACVLYNRLARRMRLQTDPTVMYATMLRHGGEWSRNISREDLAAQHPYNTYAVIGLPPGPIASPGAAALRAALHPARCDDIFFVSRNDGTHVFCPDLACHEAAVRRWQLGHRQARAAR